MRFNAGDPTLLLKLADLTYLRALQEVFMVNADYGLNRHLYAVMDREAELNGMILEFSGESESGR